MNRLDRAAVVVKLVEKLRSRDGWAGETQVQKSVYFLERLMGVEAGWSFSLYKFGPFSFDLRDALAEMQSDGFLELEPQRRPYGPRLAPGPSAGVLFDARNEVLEANDASLEFVADKLAGRNVSGLERIATALFVAKDLAVKDPSRQAETLHQLKPHVTLEEAEASLARLDEITAELN